MGPYLNGAMPDADAPAAHAAARRAAALARVRASAVERALAEAMRERYARRPWGGDEQDAPVCRPRSPTPPAAP